MVTGTSPITTPGENVYDFGEVLESIDISHAFIKGQVSMTALFGFGLLAGGLGLTGEDEEDRRRRRAAEFQGVPYLYDPRDISNDFRNADVLYLDRIPFLSEVFKVTADDENGTGGRSMANMNFLLKQVMSPILGMNRFLENGNPHEVLWGFQDAIGSLPLINTMGWESASLSYDELMAKAEGSAATGNPEDLPETYRLMLSAVSTLERQLLENSFANQVYVGLDKFDRDPWKVVEKDAEGGTVTDRLGNPQKTGAMTTFTDPETGETRQGYLSNSWQGAYVGNLTENRLTLALLNELVTLGKADALRTDMVVKTRKFDNEQISVEQAMEAITFEQKDGVIRAMWKGAQRPEDLNLEGFYLTREDRKELEAALRNELTAQFIADGFTEKEAFWKVEEVWKGPKTNPDVTPLRDIVWSQNAYDGTIPWKQSTEYFQLNTTYIKGPDGNYWATGVSRNLLDSFAGLAPLTRYTGESDTGLGTDSRLNSTDSVRGINTGMRSLMRVEESFDVPESEAGTTATTSAPTSSANGWEDWGSGGSGWRNFGRRSGYSRSGGSSGGGGGSFTKLNAPQDSQTPYTNSTQNISMSNPIIRRSSIRRERSDSDKGRLKPWQ